MQNKNNRTSFVEKNDVIRFIERCVARGTQAARKAWIMKFIIIALSLTIL